MEQVFYAIRICRQQAEPSDDEMKDNGCQPKKALCSAPLVGPTPGVITSKMGDTVSSTDLRPCAKFLQDLFSSFGGDATPTDRHAYKQQTVLIK